MAGTPGRDPSHHLIEAEAYRRIMSGEVPQTLSEFAQKLFDWFRNAYPGAAPTTLHIIEDQIRDTWHRRHELIRGG